MNNILTFAVAGILFAGIGTTGIANGQTTDGKQQNKTIQTVPRNGFSTIPQGAQRGPRGFARAPQQQGGRQMRAGRGAQRGPRGFARAPQQGGRQMRAGRGAQRGPRGFARAPQQGGFGFGGMAPQARQPRGPQARQAHGPQQVRRPHGPQAGPKQGPGRRI